FPLYTHTNPMNLSLSLHDALPIYLPIAVVAGLLFLVAWNLIDFRRIRKILATSRGESAVLAVTFFATLLLDLEFAILVGVLVSLDRKSTRLNSSHVSISYAVFCLK